MHYRELSQRFGFQVSAEQSIDEFGYQLMQQNPRKRLSRSGGMSNSIQIPPASTTALPIAMKRWDSFNWQSKVSLRQACLT